MSRVNVQSCTLRRDGQYLVAFRTVPGAVACTALSPVPVREGSDVIVRDGKVVKS